VLRIEVDPSEIYVDGRDFLFFSFQRVDRWIDVPERRDLMSQAFGKKILRWAERAAMQPSSPASIRINVACHACRDPGIILAHLRSKIVLFGKANFYFCSAFRFLTPVPKDRVSILAPQPVWTSGDLGLSFQMLGL
jgi:hypothetical protein